MQESWERASEVAACCLSPPVAVAGEWRGRISLLLSCLPPLRPRSRSAAGPRSCQTRHRATRRGPSLVFWRGRERERELEEKERKDERRRAISTVFVSFARGVRCVFSFCFGSVKVQQRSRETDGTCPRGCECRGAQSRKSGRTRLSSPSLRSIFCASRRRRAAMPSFFSRPLPLSTLSSLFFPSSIFSSA